MKLFRKLFFLSISFFLIWSVFSYNESKTEGFSIWQITSTLPPSPRYRISPTEDEKKHLQHILNQEFYYLGKGCQCYAFESEDGAYVLKFFKHKHLRPLTWLSVFPLPKKWRNKRDSKVQARQKRIEDLFLSCKLAYEKMQDETALIFVHLDKSPALECSLTLVDKRHRKFTIELDQYEFLIQKKATGIKQVFAEVENQAQYAFYLDQLVDLIKRRCQKGIADRDPAFVQNVAFCLQENKAIFIDTGQFYEDEEMQLKKNMEADIQKRMEELHIWLTRYFPDIESSSSLPKEGIDNSPSSPS